MNGPDRGDTDGGGAGGPTPAAPPSRRLEHGLAVVDAIFVTGTPAHGTARQLLRWLLEHPDEVYRAQRQLWDDETLPAAEPWAAVGAEWRRAIVTELAEESWALVVPVVAGVAWQSLRGQFGPRT